jgi:hypothetical protein
VGDGKRIEPLQQHQINEAGYLTARASMGQPIDDTAGDLRRLIDGNETTHDTRVLLSSGRGNVAKDNASTGGTSGQLADATRMAAATVTRENDNYSDVLAAAGLAVAAGSCGENARVAARLHAPKLQGQETVSKVRSTSFDHGWAEIDAPHRPSVVMDPWANGPAMQAGDTAWHTPGRLAGYPSRPDTQGTTAPLTLGSTQKDETFSGGEAGTAVRDGMFKNADWFARGPGRSVIGSALLHTPKTRPLDCDFTLAPPLAISLDPSEPGFGEKARHSVQSQQPLHQEILAVGAVRDGYQLNVAAAAAQAQPVLQAAQTLDTMPERLARPPLWKPQG